MRTAATKDVSLALEQHLPELITAIQQIPYASRRALTSYLQLSIDKHQIDAATKDSETDIRRAQGAFKALDDFINVFDVEPRPEGIPNPNRRNGRRRGTL